MAKTRAGGLVTLAGEVHIPGSTIIRATSIDSFALGYRTIVPRDCVFDQGSIAHEQNLTDIGMRYVGVESAEVVMREMKAMKSAVGRRNNHKPSPIPKEA